MKSTERLKQLVASQYDNHDFFGLTQLIKLCVITQFFPPDYAATGQLIEELVRHLEQQGVDIEVFTGQPSYAFETPCAQSVEQFGRVKIKRSRIVHLCQRRIRGKTINGILFMLRAAIYLLRAVQHRNLLLLTTAPPFLPILGYLAHIFFGISYVCVLYDLYPDIAIALGVLPKHHFLAQFWKAINREVLRKAKGIVVLSPAMKQQVVENYPEVANNISVIHSWADPEWIVPIAKKDNWFAQQYNIVNKFTVLYSGNMGRCHDIHTILETAKYLQDDPIQFVCIGGGVKREEMIEEVHRLGLRNFLFLPYQKRQVLPYSLTACDLSLVSVDAGMESLVAPSKLYPALATGRPVAVICPQHSYLRELIANAKCGDTFENADSYQLAEFIRLLSCHPRLAERMGRSARQYLQSYFTPQVISHQYSEVLLRAIL
ncbi:glycosyltransferase family 4 protein [Aetokthonos hydrillicola Thurmond2011]|uniref:Glycosyltransferase family 4 protein n=1 Tax=Aetokthonos hydrillicola Thurmond2011 TaxID=2712845 RepID=A0AAP5I444_9CYAN|nr:glycosyltransferase family 4 protein [Aetokthonos hydrillicola]MBW4584916.1 glycosyltransferase family 4 protein [Aetokthonos hydrillicola CCALA 1050]MDR9894325.1 glycosyltransferase family 4 protein [Aetokthonos hydrillicola Thurmond2011]